MLAGSTKSIVFGAINHDFWLVKIEPNGDIEWEKRYKRAPEENQ